LKIDPESVGIVMSSSKGFWPQRLQEPFFDVVDWLCCDGAARSIARWLGSQGPVLTPVAACATGAHSVALGANWIEDGRCDVVIAGAVERPIEPLIQAGYQQLGAVSQDIMRPFDQARDGFVPNAGMGFLVLENAEKARARGLTPHAYLAGHCLSGDGGDALNMENDGASIVRAIKSVLKRAQVLAGDVDYVNVHGTATIHNDQVEARALREVFGLEDGASTCKASATKPLTGHLLGASGAVEAVLCVQALREGFVPPTLNLHDLDEDCAFDWTPGAGQSRQLERALSLSYGFGGHVAALLFEK
jgi:3-oxoacyl-(acyl-carrier-protein) synthase